MSLPAEAAFARDALPHRKIITGLIILATLMQALDSTIANVALPHMQGALSATVEQTSWVLTSYLIAAAIATPVTGWIAGRLGRRNFFLVALAGFTAASMLCGAAQTLDEMVLFRFLQGLFGAGLLPLSQSMILDIYSEAERGPAMAVWGMGVMVGPILGPPLGGYLTDLYDWRYIFYINLPIGVLCFLGVAAFLPREARRGGGGFDWTGFAVLALFIGALQLMLDRGETQDWFSAPEIAAEALLAGLGLYLFLVHSALSRNKLIDLSLFRQRSFMVGSGLQFFTTFLIISASALLPPYLQNLGNYSVTQAGIAMAPRGAATMIGMLVVGRIGSRIDVRLQMLFGVGLITGPLWAMAHWTPDVSTSAQLPTLAIQGFGLAFMFIPAQLAAFSRIPAALRTEASSLYALARSLGGSIGIALSEAILTRNGQVAHQDLAALATPFNRALTTGGPLAYWDTATSAGAAALDAVINRSAQIVAYSDAFLLLAAAAIPCTLLILVLGPLPRAVADADEIVVPE